MKSGDCLLKSPCSGNGGVVLHPGRDGLRILIVNCYARVTGGADVHCLELVGELRRRGHDVRFLSTESRDNEDENGWFVPLSVSNSSRGELRPAQRLAVLRTAIWSREAVAAIDAIVAAWRPTVAHIHKAYPQLSVGPIVRLSQYGIPVVQTVHDYEFVSASSTDTSGAAFDTDETTIAYRALNSMLFQIKRRAHVPRVASWVSVSRAMAVHYARAGIETTVLPNFVLPRRMAIPGYGSRNGLLYVGRLVPEKGLDDVLLLASMSDMAVSVVGGGVLRERVEAAAAVLPNLTYHGLLDRAGVGALIRKARVVLMPSRWEEPGPLAALEAMEAGTPVVAFPAGGLSEYISDAGAGIVTQPTSDALHEAATQLHNDKQRWARASAAGRHAAATRHSPSTYAEAIIAIYDHVQALPK